MDVIQPSQFFRCSLPNHRVGQCPRFTGKCTQIVLQLDAPVSTAITALMRGHFLLPVQDDDFFTKETTVLRIGVYLVDVLDEAHGYTFIADTYSGSDGNQPGVIDVKIRIVGINVMFLLLHLIMHATFGPIVLSGFTLICFASLFCRSSSGNAG